MEMNKCTFTGRITKDLEIREAGDTKILDFSLAVYRDKDTTDFFTCTAFNRMAELIVQYCKKGTKITLSGAVNDDKHFVVSDIDLDGFSSGDLSMFRKENRYEEN